MGKEAISGRRQCLVRIGARAQLSGFLACPAKGRWRHQVFKGTDGELCLWPTEADERQSEKAEPPFARHELRPHRHGDSDARAAVTKESALQSV